MSTETEKENGDETTDREPTDEWHVRPDLRRALTEAYARLEYVNDETPEEFDMGHALDEVLQTTRDMDTAGFREARKTFEDRADELRDGRGE